jgi:C4-dicarboxylate-binding protein DctP
MLQKERSARGGRVQIQSAYSKIVNLEKSKISISYFFKKHRKQTKMTRIQHYALMFMILAIITSNIYAQPTFVINFSHVNTPDSPKGAAAAHFKKLAEEMTKGRVQVNIYPNGELYQDNVALEALQLGAVQMLAPSPSKISTIGFHEFELFDIPFLFPNREALYRVTQGPIGIKLLNKLETKGIVGLSFWDNGYKSMFSNTPIRTPGDMQGLKMRVDPSAVLASQMKNLGAVPYTVSFADMVNLLFKNVIDGTEGTPSNLYSQKELQLPKYLTITNHGYLVYTVIVNKQFWRKLPPEIRVQLQNAMQEATKYANKVAQQQNESGLAKIKESGKTIVFELSDNEKNLWREALLPVQKEMQHRIGTELMDELHRTIGDQDG